MSRDELLRELLGALDRRERCALVTVAAARGSTPREAGAKMLVYATGGTAGTIGGGGFEALVIKESLEVLAADVRQPKLKTYPLHEGASESFGAVCGGEVTVLIEPQAPAEALFLVGAGHCARALARLAGSCGWHVTVMDQRPELLADFPAASQIAQPSATEFISQRAWRPDEALVIVSHNYLVDRDALLAALRQAGMGYLGMMGSRRKVRLAFDEALAAGISPQRLNEVYAPVGLDLKAETPDEIAISVMAQILQVMRAAPGGHLAERAAC